MMSILRMVSTLWSTHTLSLEILVTDTKYDFTSFQWFESKAFWDYFDFYNPLPLKVSKLSTEN